MFIESYGFRLLALIAFFVVVASIDFFRKGNKAVKWKQYLVVLCFAGVFAVFGAIHDQFTVSISKEYYVLGKGLSPVDLRLGVLELGLKTGSYAGIFISIVLLYFGLASGVEQSVKNTIPVAVSAIAFVLVGIIFGLLFHLSGYRVVGINNAAFLAVWGWHIGLYFGAIVGLFYVVKKRKTT